MKRIERLIAWIAHFFHKRGGCCVYRHGVSVWGNDDERWSMLAACVADLDSRGYDMRYVIREVRRVPRKVVHR